MVRRLAGRSVWWLLLPLLALSSEAVAGEREEWSADVVYLLDVSLRRAPWLWEKIVVQGRK